MNPHLLEQILVALTNAQLNPPQTAQPEVQNRVREPRLPDVDPFNGSKTKFHNFLAKIKNFFAAQPRTYDTDDKKISYVISRLEGTAENWAATILENSEIAENHAILTDWDRFMDKFSKFSDSYSRRNATNKLLALKQGRSESVLSFWTRFSELLYRSEIQEDSARPIFERGLRMELRERMADKDYSDELIEFVDAVIALDD